MGTTHWTLGDLEYWDEKAREIAIGEFGLTCYPQEFEVCDQNAMIGYMAYHGMPSHYPHWSFGKSFEQTKTMYDLSVSGLPYEMVINSNPSIAYLMRDNSLCLQILTIAHVYGHNDFFKNNFTFTSGTNAKETIASFKARADRIRNYMGDPSIGEDPVEEWLDAAHALSFSRSRNLAIRERTPKEMRQQAIDDAEPEFDPFSQLHTRVERKELDLRRFPLEPVENVLLFIRDHNPHLTPWQRDILTIVDQEACYFLPQIETKIMNEGWASHWHHRILARLQETGAFEKYPDVYMEFMVRHNQVICPHPGGLNPYHVGFVVWRYIESGVNGIAYKTFEVIGGDSQSRSMTENEVKFFTSLAKPYLTWKSVPEWSPEQNALFANKSPGNRAIFDIRVTERDRSFLRRFLTRELIGELDLFNWKPRGEHLVVSEVADDDNWEVIKRSLLNQVGTGSMPRIRIHDANYKGTHGLYLVHDHEGRDLEMTHADKTLNHLRDLWSNDVYLLTKVREKQTLMSVTSAGFDAKLVS